MALVLPTIIVPGAEGKLPPPPPPARPAPSSAGTLGRAGGQKGPRSASADVISQRRQRAPPPVPAGRERGLPPVRSREARRGRTALREATELGPGAAHRAPGPAAPRPPPAPAGTAGCRAGRASAALTPPYGSRGLLAQAVKILNAEA